MRIVPIFAALVASHMNSVTYKLYLIELKLFKIQNFWTGFDFGYHLADVCSSQIQVALNPINSTPIAN